MSTEPEHEIVPAIRAWLAATADVEIPLGLSREDSRHRGRELLAAIEAGSVVPDQLEAGDELKDILWASVEELDGKTLGRSTFEECNTFYQFVAALTMENEYLGERDEILHLVARIGWRSVPEGLEPILQARSAVWEHGNEERHREVCETADQLQDQIRALGTHSATGLVEAGELCARLLKLAGIRPGIVAAATAVMSDLLARQGHRLGWLDDGEYLKAVTMLAAGMAYRHLGRVDLALAAYARASSSFRRTAGTCDLDRVRTEHLVLQQVKEDNAAVAGSASALIRGLVVPRDKIKAQLVLAQALINLNRAQDARLILEEALQDNAVEIEPSLKACLLTRLGMAFSHIGKESEAVAAFNSAGSILKCFYHPTQLADLAGALGEHLGKLGKLEEATSLYRAARLEFQRTGQAGFVGYYSVLVAELMMLLGRNQEAETELRAALPLIEKFELRREAAAAVALLREAMAKRRTDVTTIQALREQLRKGLH